MIFFFITHIFLFSALGYLFHPKTKTYMSVQGNNLHPFKFPTTEFSIKNFILRHKNGGNRVVDFYVWQRKIGLWRFHGGSNQKFTFKLKNNHIQIRSKNRCAHLSGNTYRMKDCGLGSFQFKFIPHEVIESLNQYVQCALMKMKGNYNICEDETMNDCKPVNLLD